MFAKLKTAGVALAGMFAAAFAPSTWAALGDATAQNLGDAILGSNSTGAETGIYEIVVLVESFREDIFLPMVILILGVTLAVIMYRKITGAAARG